MHRDLKPENILLDREENAKLCDFGWAVEYDVEIKRKTLCGTYEYMSPEVYYGNGQCLKSDIWSLGILLFELSQGKSPYKVKNIV